MGNNIPLDGTNLNDTLSEKDPISLLIMHQAYLDATRDTEKEDEYTDEVTDGVIDGYSMEEDESGSIKI